MGEEDIQTARVERLWRSDIKVDYRYDLSPGCHPPPLSGSASSCVRPQSCLGASRFSFVYIMASFIVKSFLEIFQSIRHHSCHFLI